MDLAGINIYYQEYKKHLGDRATFFVPENIALLLPQFGNRQLYDRQKLNDLPIDEPQVQQLIDLIHAHKKGLEQEILMGKV